jgi:hypothetical protein
MKVLFLAAFTAFSTASLAQDPGSETVEVTGSRIFESQFGPIAFSGGPTDRPRPCAEPRCGQDPDDPGSGGATTVQQKTANNKKAKEKAKQNRDKLSPVIISDQLSIEKLFAWMKGIAVDVGGYFSIEITTPNVHIKGQGCGQYHTKLNPTDPKSQDYCVEREFNNETVKKANGTYENQLNLTYTIYNTCYWEKKCGLERITFIAGSEDELKSFLNETLGYQYY